MKGIINIIIIIACLLITTMQAQTVFPIDNINKNVEEKFEKCNFDSVWSAELYEILGDGWGYNYDSLLIDLDKWQNSPFVMIDSIGASVQNRALWQLIITDSVFTFNTNLKYRITIHARTHPNEVYSFYSTRAIINLLIGNTELAKRFRKYSIFNVVPIYNPDGVELGYPRENANGVDLERDWDSENPQPESAALKALYLSYMNSGLPINIALNMHNDGGAELRYFVYHHENGTSEAYTAIEQEFISGVRSYWPFGIADWSTFVSWTQSTPTHYPESWFWLNYQESVLALTFEEVTTGTEPDFIRAADALLNGIADFLELDELTSIKNTELNTPDDFALLPAYPNPFNPSTTITYSIPNQTRVLLKVYDVLGKEIATLVDKEKKAGIHEVEFNGRDLTSGIYFYRIQAGKYIQSKKMMVLK